MKPYSIPFEAIYKQYGKALIDFEKQNKQSKELLENHLNLMTADQAKHLIKEWLKFLTPQQITILSLSYGLNENSEHLKPSEIATRMGISTQSVNSQLEAIFDYLSYPSLSPLKEFLHSGN